MKTLRKSSYGDYVAVDDVSEDGTILSTPIYLKKNTPNTMLVLDIEENRYIKTTVTFDGTLLKCTGPDFDWESPLEELVQYENGRPLFKQITK